MAKAKQFPEILDYRQFEKIATLYEFDNKVTAPLHGFSDAEDYYAQSSSAQFFCKIFKYPLYWSTPSTTLPGTTLFSL